MDYLLMLDILHLILYAIFLACFIFLYYESLLFSKNLEYENHLAYIKYLEEELN